jgi:hypothetical protein
VVLELRFLGLPGGAHPPYIMVHEVAWTDTASGQPVAAALPQAQRRGDAFLIRVPSGLTRQVWLTLHPTDVPPGVYRGRLTVTSPLSGAKTTVSVPFTLHLYPLRFPDQPTLHLGGWDYTDGEGRYDITPRNQALVIAHLREHFVDSPWATSAVLPPGRYDGEGRLVEMPGTSRFDKWLRRWAGARQYCVFVSVGRRFDGTPMGTPLFAKKVTAWIRFWAEHMRRRGLRPEQLVLLLVDEPHGPEQDAIIREWAKVIRAANTGVKIWEDPTHSDPYQADQEMMALCHVLCPNRVKFLTSGRRYRAYFIQRRQQGTELAFYSCSGPARLLDPYTYYRLQAWVCWQYGARASYFWAFGDAAGASSWNEYLARRNAYVPYFLDSTSVTPGKHMEAIREGVEDYEYLVMLRDAIARAEQRGAPRDVLARARRLLVEAVERVCDPKTLTAFWWSQPKDRTVADRVRKEILDVLVALRGARRAPRSE